MRKDGKPFALDISKLLKQTDVSDEERTAKIEAYRQNLRDTGQVKNADLLADFTAYCYENPEQRFWQALRNWSKWAAVYVAKNDDHPKPMDTYYWTRKDGM